MNDFDKCEMIDCYWNLFNPNSNHYNNESDKFCVSESLNEIEMIPNSKLCKGYLNYYEFCGCYKGE